VVVVKLSKNTDFAHVKAIVNVTIKSWFEVVDVHAGNINAVLFTIVSEVGNSIV
jgi:hypothetical protein